MALKFHRCKWSRCGYPEFVVSEKLPFPVKAINGSVGLTKRHLPAVGNIVKGAFLIRLEGDGRLDGSIACGNEGLGLRVGNVGSVEGLFGGSTLRVVGK